MLGDDDVHLIATSNVNVSFISFLVPGDHKGMNGRQVGCRYFGMQLFSCRQGRHNVRH